MSYNYDWDPHGRLARKKQGTKIGNIIAVIILLFIGASAGASIAAYICWHMWAI